MKKGFWITVKDIIRKCDIVLEVLDARFPELTRIRTMEDYASFYKKKLILVINKADIVSETTRNKIRKQYPDAIMISAKTAKGVNGLLKQLRNAKVAIIGYPNTGKSCLINRLSIGGKARTSSESGFTRGMQLIAGKNNLRLFDTPGIVPFRERDEVRLGLVSGISPSKLNDPDIVAYKLIKLFMRMNPSSLKQVYGISDISSPEEFILEFGRKKNMLLKGGIIDERRAAIQFLIDWHNGKIRL